MAQRFSKQLAVDTIQDRANRIQREHKFKIGGGTAQLANEKNQDRIMAYGQIRLLRDLYMSFTGETLRIAP